MSELSSPDAIHLAIADFTIKLTLLPTEFTLERQILVETIHNYYRNFYIDTPRSIDIEIRFTDLTDEISIQVPTEHTDRYYNRIYEYSDTGAVISYYHISLIQLQGIVWQLIQDKLRSGSGFSLHASAALVNDQAYIFTGPSTVGKSTIISLLKDSYTILADDVIVIRKIQDRYQCFQTPYFEKPTDIQKTPEGYPVGKIFFPHKSDDFKVRTIDDKRKRMLRLTEQIWMSDTFNKRQFKTFVDFINSGNSYYDLDFAQDKKKMLDFISRL